jgi:hypothetical protein
LNAIKGLSLRSRRGGIIEKRREKLRLREDEEGCIYNGED